jgi:hypothetical protein
MSNRIKVKPNVTRVVLKYPLLNCSEVDLERLKEDFHVNRRFNGASGTINLNKVKLNDIECDKHGSVTLELTLETPGAIADYEAPIIANAIIEKNNNRVVFGTPITLKIT